MTTDPSTGTASTSPDPTSPAGPRGATGATGTTDPADRGATSPDVWDVTVVEPTGPAFGTLVWGCVALAVAALLGAWELGGVRVDLGLVVPAGMVLLGLLLVVGALVTLVRQRR